MRARMATDPKIRLRIVFGDVVMLGPGKADLLEGIRETGSIAAAGRRMKMSYKRAWMLVETMNAAFRRAAGRERARRRAGRRRHG